ncbi:hypothetical protein AVEN_270907-1 [Araneus ventricosus]|uniref:Uncharacterized protein n=1 Tax=Araneus ventricosus TaxID=182803 RepID=A0A4Y2I225_ARAVE|nr:hypothetical protein AVEN_270907-1 [Araneus ventricosus]
MRNTGIETLVIQRDRFLYIGVEEICCQRAEPICLLVIVVIGLHVASLGTFSDAGIDGSRSEKVHDYRQDGQTPRSGTTAAVICAALHKGERGGGVVSR